MFKAIKKQDCVKSPRFLCDLLMAECKQSAKIKWQFCAKCSCLDISEVPKREPRRFSAKRFQKKCWFQKATADDSVFMRSAAGEKQQGRVESHRRRNSKLDLNLQCWWVLHRVASNKCCQINSEKYCNLCSVKKKKSVAQHSWSKRPRWTHNAPQKMTFSASLRCPIAKRNKTETSAVLSN